MAWYVCTAAAAHNPNGIVWLQHPDTAPTCTQCGGATAAAHNAVRFQKDVGQTGGYEVKWHVTGDVVQLKVCTTVNNRAYEVLLPATMNHEAAVSVDTVVPPPAGARWTDQNFPTYGGGYHGRNAPAMPSGLRSMQLRIGTQTGAHTFGLVHILHRHAKLFGNMQNAPAAGLLTLDDLLANLTSLTGPPPGANGYQQGTGVRKLVWQDNTRSAIHGVSRTVHILMIVDNNGKIITAYEARNLSGLGHAISIRRDWGN